jgi:hypothetical protein
MTQQTIMAMDLVAGGKSGEALPGWLNVKAFGAQGDLQAIIDAEMIKGSPVLKSAAGRFKNAALGWPFLSNVFPHFENLAVSITDFRTIHNGAPFGPSVTALNMFDVQAASTRNVVSQWNHFGISVTEKRTPHIMISSYSVEVDNPDDGVVGWEGTPDWTANGDDYNDPKDSGRGLIYYCAWNKGYANLRITNGGNQKITITNLGKW